MRVNRTHLGILYFTSDQLAGFHRITVPRIVRNSIFLLDGIKDQQTTINPEDEANITPLMYGHINFLGSFKFALSEEVSRRLLCPISIGEDDIN